MCRKKFFTFCYLFLIFLNTCLIINADNETNNFEVQRQQELEYYRKFVDFYTLNSDVIKSEQCKIDCEIYRKAFYNKEMWAIGMYDSSSKMQSGFLSGNLADFGDFNQCINMEVNIENGTTIRGKHVLISLSGYVYFTPFVFQTQRGLPMEQFPYINYLNNTLYNFKVYVGPTANPRQPRRALPSHRWAICIPDSCNLEEIIAHLGLYMDRDNVTKISRAIEQTLDSQWGLRDYDWISISILIGIAVILVVQTVYDTYLHYTNKKTKHWSLTAFSVLSNGRRLFATSNRPEMLPCLDGIRVICMIWIMIGHETESNMFSFNYNSIEAFQMVRPLSYQFISANQVHLHQFFMLSGFLIMYGFLRTREREPTFNIFKFYIRRYLRLTPSLIAAILFHISIVRLIGSGPMYQVSLERLEDNCKKYWWRTLLYVSNYIDSYDICVPQSWYLCVDQQLYWLAPLLLLPVVWWKKCAYYLFGILTIVGVGIVWYVAYDNKLIPNGEPSDYIALYHIATHCRITPWIIGHGFGFFMYQNRNKKFNIPMWLATLLWILAISLGAYATLGMYPIVQPEYEYNRAYMSYYIAMSSVFFCFASCWIIFACIYNYGGILNWFLSMSLWQPLSKLTYSMFLIHYAFQLALHATIKTPTWYSGINLFYNFCGLTITTTLLSIVWTLSFEMPFMVIDSQLFKKNVSKPEQQNQMTLSTVTPKNDGVSNNNGNGSRL